MATAAKLIAAKKAKEKEEAAKEAAKEAEAQQRRQLQRREMTPDNLRIVEQKLLEFQKQQEVEQSRVPCTVTSNPVPIVQSILDYMSSNFSACTRVRWNCLGIS